MNLLVLGRLTKEYAALIGPEAPELTIYTSEDYGQGMLEAAPGAEIVLGYLFPDELLKEAAALKWIQLMSAGADQVIFSPLLKDDVQVTTARGVHSPQMAEYALGVLVSLARNLPEMVRNQERRVWKQWPGETLKGKTLGIIGFGAVGQEIAKFARALGMRVVATRKSGQPHLLADAIYGPKDMGKVLAESDFVIVAVPLTPETHGLIGPTQLAQMKRGAFLINLSRGGIVDEAALVQSLRQRQLAGAALDVFDQEPLLRDSPLWEAPNLLITPHISGLSRDYVRRVTEIFVNNLRRFQKGQPLLNLVDRSRGY